MLEQGNRLEMVNFIRNDNQPMQNQMDNQGMQNGRPDFSKENKKNQ